MLVSIEVRVGYAEIVLSGALSDAEAVVLSSRVESALSKGSAALDDRVAFLLWNLQEATDISEKCFCWFVACATLFRIRGKPSVVVHPPPAMERYLEAASVGTLLPTANDDSHAAQMMLQSIRREYSGGFFTFLINNHYVTAEQLKRLTSEHKARSPKRPIESLMVELSLFSWKTLLAAQLRYQALQKSPPSKRGADRPGEQRLRSDETSPPAPPQNDVFVAAHMAQVALDAEGPLSLPRRTAPASALTQEPGDPAADEDQTQAQPLPKPQSEFAKPSLFGAILVEIGIIRPAQLRQALEQQRTDGGKGKLGDYLIRMGFVTDDQVFRAVEEQYQRRGGARESKPRRGRSEFFTPGLLGEILVEQGILSREALNQALAEQRVSRTSERIGSILLRLGLVTREQVFLALTTQTSRKRGMG